MKIVNLTIALMLALSLMAFNATEVATYQVDLAKSNIRWTGYASAGSYAPTGSIKLKSGTLKFENNRLISGKFEMDMTAITTENKELENHLKNKDFFEVKKYPTSSLILTEFKGTMAVGWLTIKHIRKQITFPVKVERGEKNIVVKTILKIDRTQFDIKYNSDSYFQDLGNYAIKNEFDVVVELNLNR